MRRRPKEVVEHRISFQDSERQMVEDIIAQRWLKTGSEAFSNIATPIVKLLNDVTGLAAFLTLSGLFVGFKFYPSEIDNAQKMIEDFIQQAEEFIEESPGRVKAGIREFLFGWMRMERRPGTRPEDIAAHVEAIYQTEPGINPATGEPYSSPGELWAAAYGVEYTPPGTP